MRFAGEVEYEVGDNAEIEEMMNHFTGLLKEAIPTSGDKRWTLRLMFEASA